MRRRVMGIAVVLLLAPSAAAQPERAWIRQLGTTGEDFGLAGAANGDGVFVAGQTGGALGGPKVGLYDAFVARYRSDGEFAWIRQFGADNLAAAQALAADALGGAFVGGYVRECCFREPFVARYKASGDFAWMKVFGSGEGDEVKVLAPDGAGGFFVGGETLGELGGPYLGNGDVFLARFDQEGNMAWLIQFGTDKVDLMRGLASDGKGGVYATGGTSGDLAGPNKGLTDAWLARYSEKGKLHWAVQFGTDNSDTVGAVAVNPAGHPVVVGGTTGNFKGQNAGDLDVYLAAFSSGDGKMIDAAQFGTAEMDQARGVVPDAAGGAIIAGETRGALAGAPNGEEDIFLVALDADGGVTNIEQMGTAERDSLASLAPHEDGVLIAGTARGILGGPHAGGPDAFVGFFRAPTESECQADCDGNGVLDLFDFLCFVNLFNAGC